ncbi:MAG: CARDB domain-containing protein, partial [Kiritimatiellia bacterium]|nr:CARDB domain-containing protein [Kiritimatiellia bacterium]
GSGGGDWMKPDFVITSIEFDPEPRMVGDEFFARITVVNQGDVAGDAGQVKIWLTNDAGAEDGAVAAGMMDVDDPQVVVIGPLTAPPHGGWYQARGVVDADALTAEKSENNNHKWFGYRLFDSIVIETRETAEGLEILWNSRVNFLYTVERSDDLAVGFFPIATDIVATPPMNVFLDTAAPSVGTVVYRVKVK